MINPKLITDNVFNVALKVIEKYVKEGWMINPNDKVVKGVVKGLFRCEGDCPCANTSAEKQCPCSGYRENDYCCCGLYVRKEGKE